MGAMNNSKPTRSSDVLNIPMLPNSLLTVFKIKNHFKNFPVGFSVLGATYFLKVLKSRVENRGHEVSPVLREDVVDV